MKRLQKLKEKEKKSNIGNFILLAIITIVVLYFSLKDNFTEIVNEIITINPFWLLVGVGLVFAYWYLRSIELCSTIRKFHPEYNMRKAFRLIIVTQFFNAVTPFATGGQPFQVYVLKKDGVKLTDSTNVIIQNFIVYQIALVILGAMAIMGNATFHLFKEVGLLKDLVTLGFIINSAVVVFLFVVAFARKFNKWVTRYAIRFLHRIKLVKNKEVSLKRWDDYINNFHDGAKLLMKNKYHFARSVFYNFLALVCLYLVPLVLLYGMGDYESIDGIVTIAASAYVMLMGSFVPIPGGTGGLEFGFIAFFGNFIGGSKLSALMLLWRFITYYFGMFVGAIALNMKEKRV